MWVNDLKIFSFNHLKLLIFLYCYNEVMLSNSLTFSSQCVPVESTVRPAQSHVCALTTARVIPSTAPVSATPDGSARTAPNVRCDKQSLFLFHSLCSVSLTSALIDLNSSLSEDEPSEIHFLCVLLFTPLCLS